MKRIFKIWGIISLVAVIGFGIVSCGGDDGGGGDVPPDNKPVAKRWGKWVDPTSTATVNYSVGNDGVCTIIVGGVAQPNNQTDDWGRWKARAHYDYTKNSGKAYVYTFEAWTQSGNRELSVQYHEDNDDKVYYQKIVPITDTRTTYTVYGDIIPKSRIDFVGFLCADQLGIFYVKIISITENTGGSSGTSDLAGTITISPSTGVTVNTELTANYSGSETVSYQWKKGDDNVGTNSNKYTPTTAGSYTVTVSASGYNSKTSSAVTVTGGGSGSPDLTGTITISPTTASVNTQLTATYSGSETVSYQWKKGTDNVGINSNKYTPTQAGSYTVTVNAAGYNSKTSDVVTVTIPDLSGTITIDPAGPVGTGTQLTATYSGSETVRFQWQKDGNNIGSSSTTNPNKYTPSASGSYTVTVSATGYNSNTSDAVTVLSNLSGNITIRPSAFSYTNVELTATYSGSETVSYQWKKDGDNIGTASTTKPNKFTPTEAGNYTVTVSLTDYIDKTSATVEVTVPTGPIWTAVADSTFSTGEGNTSSDYIYAIAYANNKYIVGGSRGKMATSSDGTTWTKVSNSPFDPWDIKAISYGNSNFVAGSSYGQIAISSNGTSWTAATNSSFGTSRINAIAYGSGKFVAVGDDSKIATSTNGTSWTQVTHSIFNFSDPSDATFRSIVYANNKFIVAGNSSVSTSTDGTTWTSNKYIGFKINAIAYGNGKFVAVGENGKMATSTDGTTWTTVTDSTFGTSGYDSIINAIAYGNGKFVAVGYSGKMAYSTDGITWTAEKYTSFGTNIINAIAYGNGKFVAVGSSGKIAYLLDE